MSNFCLKINRDKFKCALIKLQTIKQYDKYCSNINALCYEIQLYTTTAESIIIFSIFFL